MTGGWVCAAKKVCKEVPENSGARMERVCG